MGKLLQLHDVDDDGGPSGPVPDGEVFAAFLVSQGLADSTVRTYVPLCQRFLDHVALLGADPLDPGPHVVRSWAGSLQAGRPTLAQARAVVGHWCTMVGADDMHDVIKVPKPSRSQVRALSDEQAAQLAQEARGAGVQGLAVLVGLYTAARRSEIASLAWPRVDFDGGWVTLDRVKVNDQHVVPLHPSLREALEARAPAGRWNWSTHGTPWVFPGHNGGHVVPSTIWSWVKDVASSAGVESTPHQLRHTALTIINDRTGNLRAAQQYAGHSSPDVTARYTRSTDETLQAAVRTLDY